MAVVAAAVAAVAAAQAVRAGAGAARAAVGRVLTAAKIPAAAVRAARHFQNQDIPAAAALSLSASACSK
jgi:UDP:flavonoid glycosyltransferase YjiC (YdhE family)